MCNTKILVIYIYIEKIVLKLKFELIIFLTRFIYYYYFKYSWYLLRYRFVSAIKDFATKAITSDEEPQARLDTLLVWLLWLLATVRLISLAVYRIAERFRLLTIINVKQLNSISFDYGFHYGCATLALSQHFPSLFFFAFSFLVLPIFFHSFNRDITALNMRN